VLKRIGHLLLIVALIATIGGHWAVLQTVAWTTMLADNLQRDSFVEAVSKTFDGEHPCKMCHDISAGKQAEKKSAFAPTAKKLEFVSVPARYVFGGSENFYLLPEPNHRAHQLAHRPPVPPPRGLFV
jgi:hypothetical protein